MENVNKQLLDAAKALVSALNDAMPHMNTGHDGVGPDCTKQFQALIDGSQAIAAAEQAQQAEPAAPVVKESLTADRQEAFRVGNLVTYNQDEYPGLGTWYVQLWEGESIAARVYGNDREELSRRVTALNVVPPPAPQKAEPVATDPAVAAIQFALETHSDGLHFLRLWNEGEFDLLRREWPEAPEDIYIGADPLLEATAQPPAVAVQAQQSVAPCFVCGTAVYYKQHSGQDCACRDGFNGSAVLCPKCLASMLRDQPPAATKKGGA